MGWCDREVLTLSLATYLHTEYNQSAIGYYARSLARHTSSSPLLLPILQSIRLSISRFISVPCRSGQGTVSRCGGQGLGARIRALSREKEREREERRQEAGDEVGFLDLWFVVIPAYLCASPLSVSASVSVSGIVVVGVMCTRENGRVAVG
jgi:hypothetical protein